MALSCPALTVQHQEKGGNCRGSATRGAQSADAKKKTPEELAAEAEQEELDDFTSKFVDLVALYA